MYQYELDHQNIAIFMTFQKAVIETLLIHPTGHPPLTEHYNKSREQEQNKRERFT